MKTLAAVLTELQTPLELWELELPSLQYGQVLVEVAYSGICRSQWNEIQGYKGPDRYLPHTLGHEGSGIVREVGPGVTKVSVGEHVVLSWMKGRGIDAGGTVYHSSQGAVNSGPISTFLRYAIISENRLIPIPKTLSLREAALLGCAVPTGAGIVLHQLKVRPGSSLAIFGVGGIGLSAILAARWLGAGKIIAIDVEDKKLAHAQALGATHTLNSLSVDPVAAVQELTQGLGVDAALECAGIAEVMETAFTVTRVSGGICVIAGNLPSNAKITIDPFSLILGKQIIGSWGGGGNIDEDVTFYAEKSISGKWRLQNLITHEVPLTSINELFFLLERGCMGRGLVVLQELS